MVKNLNKVFLIVVFIIIIGIVIINNNKDSFGATSTWTSGSWYSTFGPTGSTNYGFLQLQTNLPAGPYLLPDPGWTQPTQTNASIIAASVTYINILGIPSVTSNISDPVGFTWPTENSTYTYSPTCISGIPNNYLYSTTANGITTIISTVTTQPLKLVPDTLTTFSTGPWDTKGEYGAFNAYFQYDRYASMFMNNDFQIVPFTTNSNGPISMNLLAGMKSYYNFTSTPTEFTFKGSLYDITVPNQIQNGPTSISYNQVVGIPADFAIPGYDRVSTQGVGNLVNYGTAKTTAGYISKSSGAFTNSQLLRTYLITGVLAATHWLFNGSPGVAPVGSNIPNNWLGIITDLENNYAPNTICLDVNLDGNTPFYISYSTLHAIYLTLMARDSWIQNQITNVNNL